MSTTTNLGKQKKIFAVLIFAIINISAFSQNEYILKVDPLNTSKETLSLLTENIDFSSRYIVDSVFKIRSNEDYSLSDFENQLSGTQYSIVYYEKIERGLDHLSNDGILKSCCDITLDMDDSWGDGWNGGFVTIDIDGTSTNYSASGSGSVVTIPFCDGQNLEVSYTSGNFENENSYSLIGPSGTLFSDGPTPSTGVVYQTTEVCPDPTPQDCEGAQIVCSNNSFSGNSSGSGNYDELDGSNDGCLSGENQTSWYYINVSTAGTLAMQIAPQNGVDDYDFAIWGPFDENTANANCPPISAPIRCSYTQYPRTWSFGWCGTNTNPTGMAINGGLPTSASACPDVPYVRHLDVLAGEVYILVVDNFSGSAQPFDLNWSGSAGLDCTTVPLPVELVNFNGVNQEVENVLSWTTASEKNNDYFILQYSSNGVDWSSIENISGAGTTSELQHYETNHRDYEEGINYYRLIQVDFNGTSETHKIISIDNTIGAYVVKRVNTLGQEVDNNYKGIVIEYYSNGSIRKYFNK